MTEMQFDLEQRDGLPDALRVLLAAYPRTGWEGHANFGEMVRFWVDRHLMFREIISRIQADTEALLDRKTAIDAYAPRLSRYGGFFLNQLHLHHQIEDTQYFPRLVGLDRRLERGFEMLETDHHAIDGLLHALAEGANRVLRSAQEAGTADGHAGEFHDELARMKRLIARHLTDEEDLIVPVILETGFEGSGVGKGLHVIDLPESFAMAVPCQTPTRSMPFFGKSRR